MTAPAPTAEGAEQGGWLRPVVEACVGLAISVAVFRGFIIEGFMISTGSMAPTLYGYHKRVTCPTCDHLFARGVSPPAATGPVAVSSGDAPTASTAALGDSGPARCPNCDASVPTDALPRNHGDQLLVLKHAYDLAPPERWEVVVFRNRATPEQAYVKRAVGLPGEAVRIVGGDVFIDGRVARKPLAVILASRIAVHDTAFDDGGRRWESDDPDRWTKTETGFVAAAGDEPTRLAYRHAIRGGGRQPTAVTVPPGHRDAVRALASARQRLAFDHATGRLTTRGRLDDTTRAELDALSDDPTFRDEIVRLADASRHPPVTDRYGYNGAASSVSERIVGDLMLEVTLAPGCEAVVSLELTDGRVRYLADLDGRDGRVTLWRDQSEKPIRDGRVDLSPDQPTRFALAVIDGRATVAIDDAAPFAPVDHDVTGSRRPTAEPARVSVARGGAEFSRLVLYRDLHYTAGRGRHAVEAAHRLGSDEYFVLGDNSPISLDSRAWERAAVPASLLLGKPFIVHLPSRPGVFEFAGHERTVRVPDLARVRLIR